MAQGKAQHLLTGRCYLAFSVCAAVFAAILMNSDIGDSATTTDLEFAGDVVATGGTGLVTAWYAEHGSDGCHHDHESLDCPPCSTCSATLPSLTDDALNPMIVTRGPVFQSHYDDVVPTGIRRPPRLS